MSKIPAKNILGIVLLFLFLTATCVYADLGPRTTLNFSFTYEHDPHPAIVKTELLQCTDGSCSLLKEDRYPCEVESFGCQVGGPCPPPPPIECSPEYLRASVKKELFRDDVDAYSLTTHSGRLGTYQKLIVAFSDGTIRESKIFRPQKDRVVKYKVFVRGNTVDLKKISSRLDNRAFRWAVAEVGYLLIITLFLEVLVALIFCAVTKAPYVLLFNVAAASLCSYPVFWITVVYFGMDLVMMEILVVIFEAYFIYFTAPRRISLGRSFLLSLFINAVSFLTGHFLLRWLDNFKISVWVLAAILGVVIAAVVFWDGYNKRLRHHDKGDR